jgi:hypothetical protein
MVIGGARSSLILSGLLNYMLTYCWKVGKFLRGPTRQLLLADLGLTTVGSCSSPPCQVSRQDELDGSQWGLQINNC